MKKIAIKAATVIFLIAGTMMLGASCSGDNKNDVVVTQPVPTNQPGRVPPAPTKVTVNVTELFVVSQPIIVQQQVVVVQNITQKFATVVIVNNSQENHWIVADDGSFDSGLIPAGERAQFEIEELGEIPFHCRLHPGEKGLVRVEPPLNPTPPSPEVTTTPSETPPTESPSPVAPPVGPSEEPSPTPATSPGQAPLTLSANLSGAEQVPPVQTEGNGSAVIQVLEDRSVDFALSVSGVQGVTGAAIHLGGPGTNGRRLFTLARGPFSGTTRGVLHESDLDPLAGISYTDALNELYSGNTYVNVTSSEHPDGELRGQLQP